MDGSGGQDLEANRTLVVVDSEHESEADRVPFASDWNPEKSSKRFPAYAAVVIGVVLVSMTLVFTFTNRDNTSAADEPTPVETEADPTLEPASPRTVAPTSVTAGVVVQSETLPTSSETTTTRVLFASRSCPPDPSIH